MLQFLIKRFIGLIFVVLAVTFITFIMGFYAPGDPVCNLLGVHCTDKVLYFQLRHAYGLDLPWYQQYWNFLVNLLHFNFGYSYAHQSRLVWDILSSGVPVSLELGVWALALQVIIGVPLGVVSALRANTWVDTTNMGVMLFIYAIPVFVLAVMVQVVVVWLDLHAGLNWPVSGWSGIQEKILPILVFAGAGLAYITRLTRTSMLEVLRQDYVRTARAKGLSERAVIYRHALRNGLIPVVTVIGVTLGILVTGAFFIENIFNIPGIGLITISSVNNRDYPVIQATTILLAVAVVLGNLLSDVLYSVVDPRIKAA